MKIKMFNLPDIYYSVSVKKKEETLFSIYEKANSWTRNAWNLFSSFLCGKIPNDTNFGTGYLSLKATNGNIIQATRIQPAWNYVNLETYYGYYGAFNSSSYGIVVGASNANLGFDAYALGNKIGSGTSSGLLLYFETERPTASWNNTEKKWTVTWSRKFYNVSGDTIDVGEIGIYSDIKDGLIMVCRETFNPKISVPDDCLLLVTYIFYIFFPE